MSPIIKVIIIGLICFLANIPLGAWRERCRKFSWQWFVAIHLSVPFIIALRIYSKVSPWFIPLFIALAVAGQFAGSKLWPKRITTQE
jgi:hypothetical protein